MRAIGIILAGGNNSKMRELSKKRAIGAMPIAGSYRAIDFSLSNMSNSHIQKVAVLTQYNAWSLNEHLSSSKWWDFGRKQGGLFVFTPSITSDNGFWYRGTADAIAQNMAFLKKSHEPYAIIASADAVYKLDYNKVLERHVETGADITIVCKDIGSTEKALAYGVVTTDSNGRIVDFVEKPGETTSSKISTGIYVIRRRLLIQLIEQCMAEDNYDFVIIDCPPSLNMLTVNALTASDTVLVPIQCEYYALEGLSQLIHTIELVQDRLNPDLNIEGVVFTMYDARTNLSLQVVENVKGYLHQNIYKTIIPRNVRLAEAPSHGLPINLYDSKSAGAEAYRELAQEVLHKGEEEWQ